MEQAATTPELGLPSVRSLSPPPSHFSGINYLQLEANTACNLACQSCTRPHLEATGQRAPKNLSDDELLRILAPFRSCPIDTIKFVGLSEPMLHPRFDALVAILRSCFPDAFVIIATNCQYHFERSPFLRTLPHVDMVYLSVDGVGKLYEELRAGATYAKLTSFLAALSSNVDPAIRAKKLFLNFTAVERNYRQLPEIYELSRKHGLAGVRINLAQNWSEDGANAKVPGPEMLEYLKQYRADLKGVGGWEYRECFWPFNGVVIDAFGNLRQCLLNTTMKPLGNVLTGDARAIYDDSAYYSELRGCLSRNEAHRSCGSCDYRALSPHLSEVFGSRGNAPRHKSATQAGT